MRIDADDLISTAAELADAAREATLLHFRSAGLSADTKEVDRFDPVTIADRLSETADACDSGRAADRMMAFWAKNSARRRAHRA